MKTYFLSLILFISGLFSCTSEPIELTQRFTIDNTMTENDLSVLITKAGSEGISIAVDAVGYNPNGKLKKIQGRVDFGEAGTGTFKSENLGKIIIDNDTSSLNRGFSIVVKNKWM